jgi:hypothetical protein
MCSVGAKERVERFRWQAPEADDERRTMIAGDREMREAQGATMAVADSDRPDAALVCAARAADREVQAPVTVDSRCGGGAQDRWRAICEAVDGVHVEGARRPEAANEVGRGIARMDCHLGVPDRERVTARSPVDERRPRASAEPVVAITSEELVAVQLAMQQVVSRKLQLTWLLDASAA